MPDPWKLLVFVCRSIVAVAIIAGVMLLAMNPSWLLYPVFRGAASATVTDPARQ